MPVTMEQVLAELNRDEPDYAQAAQLGSDALPHLMRLVGEGDPGLASKATYLASFINAEGSAAVVELAARSSNQVVRIAAAGSLSNLKDIPSALAASLLNDEDVGVRKLTLKALEVHRPTNVKTKVQEIANSDPNMGLRQLASQIVNQLP